MTAVRVRSSLVAGGRLRRLHRMQRRRHALNFTHVSVMDNRHVPVVPGDRDRVPSRFGDNAAIGGITPPKNAGADLQVLGFGDCRCLPLPLSAVMRCGEPGMKVRRVSGFFLRLLSERVG